jgi:hypothetical protein
MTTGSRSPRNFALTSRLYNGGQPVTNIRNVKSPHWRGWLGKRNRCAQHVASAISSWHLCQPTQSTLWRPRRLTAPRRQSPVPEMTTPPCQKAASTGKKRCRMHDGAKGSGAPPGERNGSYRHGLFTREAIAERRALRALIETFAALCSARS